MRRPGTPTAVTLVSLFLFALTATAKDEPSKISYREMIDQNRVNVAKVTPGMTKSEVMKVMGNIQSKVKSGPIDNPWMVEFYDDREVLHFITSRHPPFMPIMANQATPVILKAGKVVGVGRAALNEAKAGSSSHRQKGEAQTEKSLKERLETLQGLYDSGTIDKKTYESQKAKILDSI